MSDLSRFRDTLYATRTLHVGVSARCTAVYCRVLEPVGREDRVVQVIRKRRNFATGSSSPPSTPIVYIVDIIIIVVVTRSGI